ncbi:magnesium transporter [bacterium]|nr:magnesium transporter [bacterium]
MAETTSQIQRPPLEDLQRALSTYLDQERFDQVRELLVRMHPAEVAALMTGLSAFERNLVFDLSPADEQHEVLIELEESDQESLLERLGDERIAEIMLQLDSDDATDLAALLDESTLKTVLEATPTEDREELVQLLGYDEESAGGLMATELVTARDSDTVREAVEAVRNARREGIEDIHYVYIVDADERLKGRITLLDIMLAPRSQPVHELYDEDTIVVSEKMDQEEVAQIFQRYDLISAPVIDEDDKLIGRITVDDIVDVIQDEAEEDIGLLTGTGEEEVSERNLLVATRARLPWLVIAFVGELFGAIVISQFEESLANIILIAFFIPVIIAVAGNIGIQSSTIVVRGLATGEILSDRIMKRVGREVLVSALNGIVLAGVLIGVVVVWQNSWLIAAALSISLFLVILMAALVGSLVPFMLKKLNLDPAMASGPFITMTNDVLGVALYLFITSSMLS